MSELEARFSSEEPCRAYLFQLRWPEGFRCPRCGGGKAWRFRSVRLECSDCGHQTSVTAGTIFQDTRKPLVQWFRAMWWVTSQKNGASALGLQRVLGLGSYKTAWTWLHKLRRAMVRPGRDRLTGRIEIDETFVGGLEEGVHGRQTETKALVVIAVEEGDTGIGRVRMHRIADASAESLESFIAENIELGSVIHTDGWPSLRRTGSQRLHSPGEGAHTQKTVGIGTAAAGAPSRVAAKALAAGDTPGSRELRTPGLLSGRVHVPIQPAELEKPREAVLPTCTTGGCGGTGALQGDGEMLCRGWRRKPQPVAATCVK